MNFHEMIVGLSVNSRPFPNVRKWWCIFAVCRNAQHVLLRHVCPSRKLRHFCGRVQCPPVPIPLASQTWCYIGRKQAATRYSLIWDSRCLIHFGVIRFSFCYYRRFRFIFRLCFCYYFLLGFPRFCIATFRWRLLFCFLFHCTFSIWLSLPSGSYPRRRTA